MSIGRSSLGCTTRTTRELRFRHPNVGRAAAILAAETICRGMTREQLCDSRAKPDGIAERLLKTKKVETLKSTKLGRNRFANRVEVENGVVVG